MANIVRSGFDRLLVATQFAAASLHQHLPARWGGHFAGGELRLKDGRGAYGGTADAVRVNWAEVAAWATPEVLVLAADHIYDMDYRALIAAHRRSAAPVTVAADVVQRRQAQGFGVMQADEGGRILAFHEKPADPPAMPGRPGSALVSMGIYVFDTSWLRAQLLQDCPLAEDFGHDLIPRAVARGEAALYRLPGSAARPAYWRDVGTLGALRRAHLDFLTGHPVRLPQPAPAAEWSLGQGSVAMPGAQVPTCARLRNTIVAPGTRIPPGLVTGECAAEDSCWFRCDGDTVLVTQAMLDRREALRPRRRSVA